MDSIGVFGYTPRKNDAIAIVIEGVGSHGSGESHEDADAIAMISAFKSDAAVQSI